MINNISSDGRDKKQSGVVRVLHVMESQLIGGAEVMVLGLLNGLDRRDFLPLLCTMGTDAIVSKAQAIGCQTTTLPLFRGKRDLSFLRSLIKVFRQHRPNIIHSHFFLPSFYSSIAGTLLNIPVISTFHLCDVMETRFERFCMRLLICLSKKVVTVCNFQADHFGLKRDSERLQIIRNGIKTSYAANRISYKQIVEGKRRLKFAEHHKLLICVGNFRKVKGHSILVDAMQMIVKQMPDVHLLLAGDGPLKQQLVMQCRERGIVDNVHFLGFVEDIATVLPLADIFVSPSLSECTSLAIMEAMAAGVPVIATAVGGNIEMIEHGKTGMLVSANSPSEIAKSVQFMLSRKDVAEELARNGVELSSREHSITSMVRSYEGLYRKLLAT